MNRRPLLPWILAAAMLASAVAAASVTGGQREGQGPTGSAPGTFAL